MGDNRFATQPVFYNKNITGVGKGQKKNFLSSKNTDGLKIFILM
jgi:hypothetical protein